MPKIIGLFTAAAVLSIALLVGYHKLPSTETPSQPVSADSAIQWETCDAQLYADIPVKCGRYFPGGDRGEFYLPLTVFEYRGENRDPAPLVYIAGGPGGGMETAPDNLQGWVYWLEEANLKRDLVVYDQRGLQPGEPYWDCERYNALNLKLLAENLTLQEEYQLTAPVLATCIEAFDEWLRSPQVDVAQGVKSFSTPSGAADLIDMLSEAGYQHWNLWGVSYGTRLALVAAQLKPESVNSLVLDSVYPLDRGRLEDKPAIYAQALERFWQVCRQAPTFCGSSETNPEALFWRVADQLRQEPQSYRVRIPDYSRAIPVQLNDHRLFALTLFALYDHRLYPELIRALVYLDDRGGDAEEGIDPVQFILTLFVSAALDRDFNSFIFYAIECNDNPLTIPHVYHEAALAEPALYSFTLWEGEYNACRSSHFQPQGLLDPEPLPQAPSLVLAGELDPVTPAHWAEALAKQLPEATLKVVPKIGHAVFGSGGCDPQLLEAYFQAIKGEGPDVDPIIGEYCH